MNVIDLTRTVEPDMPIFPGTEPPLLENTNSLEKDGFRETRLTLYSHTGTHVDAPSHLLAEGRTLSDFPPESFFGKAALLDLTGPGGRIILWDDLEPFAPRIQDADFLLLHTGWGRHWGSPEYFGEFPVLDVDAAVRLTRFPLKGIGTDTISFDPMSSADFPVHRTLLSHNFLLVENLANLDELAEVALGDRKGVEMYVSIFPLKVVGCDGSPIRATAIIDP
jgi:kynurenine formamidase